MHTIHRGVPSESLGGAGFVLLFVSCFIPFLVLSYLWSKHFPKTLQEHGCERNTEQIVGKRLISPIQNLLVFFFLKNSAQKQFRGNLERWRWEWNTYPCGTTNSPGCCFLGSGLTQWFFLSKVGSFLIMFSSVTGLDNFPAFLFGFHYKHTSTNPKLSSSSVNS